MEGQGSYGSIEFQDPMDDAGASSQSLRNRCYAIAQAPHFNYERSFSGKERYPHPQHFRDSNPERSENKKGSV